MSVQQINNDPYGLQYNNLPDHQADLHNESAGGFHLSPDPHELNNYQEDGGYNMEDSLQKPQYYSSKRDEYQGPIRTGGQITLKDL